MICPQCHTEYRPGFDQCADCNVPLVDALPEPPAPSESTVDPDAEWVTVANLVDQGDIAILRSLLESESIPFVASGDSAAMLGKGIACRFLVPTTEVARAREVVERMAEGFDGPPKWND